MIRDPGRRAHQTPMWLLLRAVGDVLRRAARAVSSLGPRLTAERLTVSAYQ